MSLIDFIEKIQKKPRYVRIQILWLSVFISMVIIVSFWVVSLKQTFPATAENKEEPLKELKENIPTFRESLKASIGGFFKKDNFEELLGDEIEKKEGQIEFEKGIEKIKPAKLPLGS